MSDLEQCPECKSTEVNGYVPGFWEDANDPDLSGSVESATEMSDRRMCRECDHEWEI